MRPASDSAQPRQLKGGGVIQGMETAGDQQQLNGICPASLARQRRSSWARALSQRVNVASAM
eukprot:5254371-Pyramimonas_sp.AAC.1